MRISIPTPYVEADGRITHVSVLKGIGHGCDEEALRAIAAMPAWTPGQQSGKPVPVKMTLPVKFSLAR